MTKIYVELHVVKPKLIKYVLKKLKIRMTKKISAQKETLEPH